MDIFNWNNPDLYFLIVISLFNSVLLLLQSYKFMQMIQLSGYKFKEYGAWLKNTKARWISRIAILSFLSFCCVYVTNVLFNAFQTNKILGYLGLVFYVVFALTFSRNMAKIPQKTPLKFTKRMVRLYVALYILYLIVNFGLLLVSLEYSSNIRASVVALTPIIIPILVPFANLIMLPIENLIALYYKHACKKRLAKQQGLIVIGITGSYGKTSTKFYLKKFLEQKYSVCASPHSYNTPMGLTKVVLNDLKPEHQVFIAEMGAKEIGDIKELCELVRPNAGIITSIGEQHLDTFKNLDNILKTKNELVEFLSNDDVCVFNLANENTKKLYKACNLKNKIGVGDKKSKLKAENIVATEDGLEFNLVFNNKTYKTNTKILGEHNIQNILCAVQMALKLGVDIESILNVIPELESAEHRLELKKLDNNILIIDDSFNSNIQGTAVALQTLKLFEGRRKIVVTPGLVELGKKEDIENIELGKRIAEVADIVVLVNKNQSENIKKGLLEKGFDEKNIHLQDSLFEVTEQFKSLLKNGDVVLLENDLPDNYK